MNSTMKLKKIVVIGSSAGGPRILKQIFMKLPRLNGVILIVQHMPKFVNDSFAANLNSFTDMTVKVAENAEPLEAGVVYLAPSEVHMALQNNERVHLFDGEKVNFVCPAVDVTLKSLKKQADTQIIGIILTGMGRDGADGVSYLKKIGGTTITQDKESSIIYGMPKEAQATGNIDYVLSPQEIHDVLIDLLGVIKT